MGSCLWVLVFGTYLYINDPHRTMRDIMHAISAQYSREQTKTRFSNIFIDMFANTDITRQQHAHLNGKTAETMRLVPNVYFIWEKHTTQSPFDDHASECSRIVCDIYAILDFETVANQKPQFFSQAACDELRSLIDLYLTHFSIWRVCAPPASHRPACSTW